MSEEKEKIEKNLSELQKQVNEIDDYIFDIHKEIVPEEEDKVDFLKHRRIEIIFSVIVFGFVFLIGFFLGVVLS